MNFKDILSGLTFIGIGVFFIKISGSNTGLFGTGIVFVVLGVSFFLIMMITEPAHRRRLEADRQKREELIIAHNNKIRQAEEQRAREISEQQAIEHEKLDRWERHLDNCRRVAEEKANSERLRQAKIRDRKQKKEAKKAAEDAYEEAYKNSPHGMAVRAAKELADIERKKALDIASIQVQQHEHISEITTEMRKKEREEINDLLNKTQDS